MTNEITFALLVLLLLFTIWLYRRVWRENEKLRIEIEKIKFAKQSLSTKYGKMTEQFIPFLKEYPYDEQNFRFIGNPIDGVQFEDDKIIFMEFKAGDSKLSERQKRVKYLVEKKKIDFEEIRIGGKEVQI